MSKLTKGNSKKCKGRGTLFFWGSMAFISVLILFNLAGCHTPDRQAIHSSCRGNCPDSHTGFASFLRCEAGDRFLEGMDLSKGQQARVREITKRTYHGIKAFRDSHKGLIDRLVKALERDSVHAEELSDIRTAYLDLLDQASAKMLHGVIELAGIITPDQRAKLIKQWKEHRQ